MYYEKLRVLLNLLNVKHSQQCSKALCFVELLNQFCVGFGAKMNTARKNVLYSLVPISLSRDWFSRFVFFY